MSFTFAEDDSPNVTFHVMSVVLLLCAGSRINDDPLLAENQSIFS